jgi:hypothetical protein
MKVVFDPLSFEGDCLDGTVGLKETCNRAETNGQACERHVLDNFTQDWTNAKRASGMTSYWPMN